MTDSMSEKTNHGGRCVFMQKMSIKCLVTALRKKQKQNKKNNVIKLIMLIIKYLTFLVLVGMFIGVRIKVLCFLM